MSRMHLTSEEAAKLARNQLSGRERRRAVRHLLTGCRECVGLVREASSIPSQVDYAAVFRRLELSGLVARQTVMEERRHAEDSWFQLIKWLDSGFRLRAIRDDATLHTWGMMDFLLGEARRIESPLERCDLVHAAQFIADRLPVEFYGEERIADFRGRVEVSLANVKRILGDFSGAKDALAKAKCLLIEGTGDPYERAEFISISASLETDLGNLEGAAVMLRPAVDLARDLKDKVLEARFRIQQSSSIGWVEPESGLELANMGLTLLQGHEKEDRNLLLCGFHLLALWSNELGRTEEARRTLETFRGLYSSGPTWRGRLLLLDGLIARHEGRYAESEDLLRSLCDFYADNEMEFDLSLATIEWAHSLVLCTRHNEARDVLLTLFPLLAKWNLPMDVLRTWKLLADSVTEESMFKKMSLLLRQKFNLR